MSEIANLQPNLLWQWFDKICAIPHPSFHEEQLAEFIVNWAKSKNLFVERDATGNILMRKLASKGMEGRPTVALQAHLDMVPQANNDTQHDFLKDPIQPYIEGDWVKARGTTLGADNGIGMASALAVLDSEDLVHPELEVLLTMDEEVGMSGVMGLQPNWLKSRVLINTDTEDNGEIYIGCAGGENVNVELPLEREANNLPALKIVLKGLNGGHSGCDIHSNRANAIKTLARILKAVQVQVPFQVADLRGGSVRNAIPREAQAVVIVKNFANFTACLEQVTAQIKNELRIAEPNFTLLVEHTETPVQVWTAPCSEKVLNFLNVLPNGVIRNSDVVKNVVETSLSIGVLAVEKGKLVSTILVRSLVESGKEEVRGKIRSLAELVGASVLFSGDYPGWEPDTESRITPLTKQVYDEVLGYEAQIKVIHAGLECGLIKEVYPNMDVVSIGPTIRNAHSPDEKVHIPAVAIYWELLTKLLARI